MVGRLRVSFVVKFEGCLGFPATFRLYDFFFLAVLEGRCGSPSAAAVKAVFGGVQTDVRQEMFEVFPQGSFGHFVVSCSLPRVV